MAIAAESAVRAWVNAQPALVGAGNPLAGGAYLRSQRSPADGAYAVLSRVPGPPSSPVAESDGTVQAARIHAEIKAGTEEAAETAAAAYATAVESLTGSPVPMGTTGIRCLASDGLSGPTFVPQPADSGEVYCFAVDASFILAQF